MWKLTLVHGEKLQFRTEDEYGHEILMDASSEYGGDAGPSPTELVLAALGGCTGMDVVTMLRNRHQEFTGYEINVSAERAEQHPRILTKIDVEHVLRGRNLDQVAVRQSVESSTNKFCWVMAMLKETAVINVSYRVLEEE